MYIKLLSLSLSLPALLLCLGLSDVPGESMVKLYCPKCCDVYTPKSSRHHHIDGVYFGTGFPHMLFMVHPELRPSKPTNQFVPRSGVCSKKKWNWATGAKNTVYIAENFHEFRNFSAIHENFLHKILGMPHSLCDHFNIPRKFSLRNAPFLPIRESFLPQKFPTIR